MTEGKRNANMGCIQKETKCIGPSLRAIKPGWETLFGRSLQDDKRGMTKGEGYRLEQTATLQLQKKVTGSQDMEKELRGVGRICLAGFYGLVDHGIGADLVVAAVG